MQRKIQIKKSEYIHKLLISLLIIYLTLRWRAKKRYKATLQYLYESVPAFHKVGATAYKPGVENMQALLEALGNPQRGLKAVHIAGTNGKGSTSHLIAASLQAAGNKVGLYTSPHLVDLRERIRVNGKPIEKYWVVDFVHKHKELIERLNPSFFELMTAMAFDYFHRRKVDVAVIEVGLGGRLDSTNILSEKEVLLSVITNIGLDHTDILGDTLEKIAAEKAGIIKKGVPVVLGERIAVSDERLAESGEVWIAQECEYLRRLRKQVAPECQLKGWYQEQNQQTAYVALRALQSLYPKLKISKEAIRSGFASVCTLTGLRGRWETLSEKPLTICDTGHNGHGFQYVAKQLEEISKGRTLRIVLGMVKDKDVDTVLGLLFKHCPNAIYYFTQAKTYRAIEYEALLKKAKNEFCLHNGTGYASVEEAVKAAKQDADKDDIIFIGGSNYVVGEALETATER